jgi:hypothetical protein
VFLIIIFFVIFLFYKEALFYYFISDDFLGFLKINNLLELVKIYPYNNHYSPVIKTVCYFFTKIFAFNPFPYHLYTIAIHFVNIYLVYFLSKLFFNDRLKNTLSILIFAFFFANYEVVFWYGGSNNSLLVTFYILSLIFLIKFIKTNKNLFSILFQVGFIFALLTHEYAISLIAVGIIYWWLFTDKKNLREFIKLFSMPVFVVVLTTILKIIFVKMPLVVRTPSILKFIAFTLRSFVYLFIPNPFIIDQIPNFFIPIIFLVILVFLFRLTKNKRTLFLLIWASLTIFIYSLTSAPQARYFYLSFVPVIIYILSVVKIKKIITVFYLLFIFISGVVFLQNQKYYWQLNSQITKNVINDVKKYSPKLQKTEVLYFVNLPDSSNDSIWKAYAFRAGFKELLNNFVNIYPKKIVFLTSFKPTSHTIEAPYIKPEKLLELKQKNIVFIYKEDLKSVVLVSNLQN